MKRVIHTGSMAACSSLKDKEDSTGFKQDAIGEPCWTPLEVDHYSIRNTRDMMGGTMHLRLIKIN
jgi:hypothetical protein